MYLESDFKLILEILGAVVAYIILGLSYTDNMFLIHPFARDTAFFAAGFWLMDCISPMIPKTLGSKRQYPRSKQRMFVAIYAILIFGLMFYVDASILFIASTVVGESVFVCCQPVMLVWVTVCYVLLRANIHSVRFLRLLVNYLRKRN